MTKRVPHSRDVASRMAEFKDAHAEYKETGSEDARLRRQRAMTKDSPEMQRRMGEVLTTEYMEQKAARKDFERRVMPGGVRPKKES